MEKIAFRKVFFPLVMLVLAFSAVHFQFWLWPFSDFPKTDEFYSLLKALGLEVYNKTIYVQFLSIFSIFFKNIDSLWKFDFIGSHLFLASAFFYYHHRRGVHPAVNIFFTSVLLLSPINVAMTRKLHFWTLGFFFFLLGFACRKKSEQKLNWLSGGLTLLTFFRYEFFLPATIALSLLIAKKGHLKNKAQLSALYSLLILTSIGLIYFFGPGMKQLMELSFGESLSHWLSMIAKNVIYLSYNTLHSFDVVFFYYLPTLVFALILLMFFASWKKNWGEWKPILKEDFQWTFIPALVVLLAIKYTDHYAIMGFVFLLSAFNFLLNSRQSPMLSIVIVLLVVPSFFLGLPDYRDNGKFFYHIRRNGLEQKKIIDALRDEVYGKSIDHPLVILFEERKPLEVLFPDLKSGNEKQINAINLCQHSAQLENADIFIAMKHAPDARFCFKPERLKEVNLLPNYFFFVKEK